MSEKAVEVKNLTKIFSLGLKKEYVVAIDNLSFEVNAGEVYGLIGPNGSGKSTTMKVVLGLMAASKGSAKVFGLDSGDIRARNEIGFLPENPYFYKHLSGAETLRFYGKLCGMKGSNLKDRIAELLKLVDLEGAADRRLAGYSKGMLQRIGLAQSLIQNPRLVILDEPTAGVDPIGSRQIRDLIMKLRDDGYTVFLCSHLLEQVQEVCDRVGILFKGRMRREGTLDELIAIENQTTMTLENASPELIAEIHALVAKRGCPHRRRGAPPHQSRTPLHPDRRTQPGGEAMSIEQTVPRAAGKAVPLFSLGRVWTIATSTVTQLVRMKTFYFLLAFALVVVAVGNFNIPATPVKELSMIKKVSFGTMDLFAWLFAIVATALLIPRDLEDRLSIRSCPNRFGVSNISSANSAGSSSSSAPRSSRCLRSARS